MKYYVFYLDILITFIEISTALNRQRIVNGVIVDIEQYPYSAQVIIGRASTCGGAIVSRRVIVTAAHCLFRMPEKILEEPDDIDIYLGSNKAMKGQRYEVCKVMKHPNFGNSREDYYWDIGLILLIRPIRLSRAVQIAKIAPTHNWRNARYTMTVAGFGAYDNTNDLPSKMSVTRLKYVSSNICNVSQTANTEPMPVPDHMFCLVGATWTSDCEGDSGSAITWKRYIVGLVSLGRDSRDGACGSESMPSMYTDLTYFRSWLFRNIRVLESKSTDKCKRHRVNT